MGKLRAEKGYAVWRRGILRSAAGKAFEKSDIWIKTGLTWGRCVPSRKDRSQKFKDLVVKQCLSLRSIKVATGSLEGD